MIVSQLLRPEDLLALSGDQLDSMDVVIEAEIIKSDECMTFLKSKLQSKLQKDYLPVIHDLKKNK